MNNQFALAKIKLSQARYKKGFFYISAITKNEEIEHLDFRYFIDDEVNFIPTKSGFRVPNKLFNNFLHQLVKDKSDEDYCCEITNERAIYIRYLEDSKGEFIDVRVYLKTEKYTGWTKQGIRFILEDYRNLQNQIIPFIENNFSIENYTNLFADKVITTSPKTKKKSKKTSIDESKINPGILKIINS